MREAIAFLLLACACGAAARMPSRQGQGAPDSEAAESAAARAGPETPATFDGLAARAATLAPGMREVARLEGVADRFLLLRAERRDACVRAAFDANGPIVARLVNTRGDVLARTNSTNRQGVLGERGPVCVRRGDTVSAVVEPAGTQVRWMAWAGGA